MVQDEMEPLQPTYARASKISASVLHGPKDLRLVSWGCFICFFGSGYHLDSLTVTQDPKPYWFRTQTSYLLWEAELAG